MKKTKRYDAGGLSDAQKEWLGGADQNDPIIMARMRSAVPDEAPEKATNYGEQDELPEVSTPKSVERTVVKTKVSPAKKSDWDDNKNPLPAKKNPVQAMKDIIAPGSFPKSFKEAGGNTKATRSKAFMPSMKINLPDPFAQFDSKGKRFSGRDTEDRKKGEAIKKMASGGRTSASKRADGCATKGFTRG